LTLTIARNMPAMRSFVTLDAETERAAIVIVKGKIFAKRREVTLSTMAERKESQVEFRIAGIVFRMAEMARLC
jgi:hypothetical protein